MNKNVRLLERTYLLTLVAIFLPIVFTPYMIHSGFTVLEEQLVEVATILLLFATGYAVLSLYRKVATQTILTKSVPLSKIACRCFIRFSRMVASNSQVLNKF